MWNKRPLPLRSRSPSPFSTTVVRANGVFILSFFLGSTTGRSFLFMHPRTLHILLHIVCYLLLIHERVLYIPQMSLEQYHIVSLSRTPTSTFL